MLWALQIHSLLAYIFCGDPIPSKVRLGYDGVTLLAQGLIDAVPLLILLQNCLFTLWALFHLAASIHRDTAPWLKLSTYGFHANWPVPCLSIKESSLQPNPLPGGIQ